MWRKNTLVKDIKEKLPDNGEFFMVFFIF